LAVETAYGAGQMARAAPESPATLREQVTSKGGTTEAALASMAADDVKAEIVRAVKAASDRARELGDLLGKD
jgi:pyrroline-5-carboxylate reductase